MLLLEGIDSVWVFAALCFAIGLAFGGVTAYLVFSRHGKQHKLQGELDQLKERFTDYREQVTQHFMHTSELMQEMTESYRSVYEHLATGAQYLCGGNTEIQQQLDAETDSPLAGNENLSPPHMEREGKIGNKSRGGEAAGNSVQH